MTNELIIRRAEINDVVEFNTLVSTLGRVPLFRATFGAFNYSNIVEYSLLALLATCGSDDNAALGFASITDASGMDSLSFENAILELKAYIPVEVTNTLFINFWAVEERNNLGVGDVGVDMINKFFTICPDIDYIVWLCPTSLKLTDYLQRLFEEVESHSESTGKTNIFKGVRILLLRRESYLLALSVRGARVEDSDDLLPILLKSNPDITDGQEKFFLANLIQTRDDNNRFYVGLTRNKLVGMLATSTDVNESLIKKVFDIDIFSDIVLKAEPKVKLPLKRIALVGNIHFLEEAALADLATELNCIFVDVSTSSSNNTGDKVGTSMLLRLDALIVDACNEYMIQNLDNFPTACILIGFPTTEAEVEAILHTSGSVDVIIEVSRSLGESAAPTANDVEVDEDAATLSHIDATDLLKTMLSAVTADEESRVSVQWRLLPDEGDVVALIADALSEAVTAISEETRLLMGDQNEEEQYYSNAFAVTLFCTAEGSETRAVDMLRVAFEDFPGLDYCICLVPNSSPVMPLVELMTAVKVRPGMSFNQSLYVMRKEHFLAKSNLGVVRLTDSLMPDLELFLKPLGVDQKTSLIAAKNSLKFNDACLNDNPMEVSFLLLFGSKVVGFVTLSRKKITNEDVNALRAGYKLDDLIDYERYRTRSQAMITHWILSPTFSRWSRFTIREIMRLYEKTLLYYQGVFSSVPAVEIVDELIPVAPRRAMQMVSRPRSGSTITSSTVGNKRFDKGPLFMITKSKLSHRKTAINSRILIVGGTAYAHAALETFCYFPNLTFSNIYVVNDRQSSPFLLGDVARFGGDSTFGSEFSGCLSVRDVDDPPLKNLFALGLAYKSTLVRGHLTDIDRENKSIVVSDEVALEYDLLLIASPNQDTTVKSFPSTKGMHPSTCAQRGIFGLGNPLADETALRWILQHSLAAESSSEGNASSAGGGVVVFGSGTDALAAIGGLIKNNVPSAKISLVIPEIELEELGHNTINESVYLALHQCGVEIYPGHVVVDVIFSNQHTLQSIQLENKHFDAQSPPDRDNINFQDQAGDRKDSIPDNSNAQTSPQFVKIECTTLLCCMRKSCDADVYTAINESGLVYDGGVVVDERFCTTDPSIYAIGSYTRFSRVYRNSIPHIRFNTRELGHFAGHKMIESLLHPNMHKSKSVSVSGRARLLPPVPAASLPVFSCPRTSSVTLPGGLTLLHSSLPGWSGTQESQSLVTGEMGADKLSILKVDLFGCAVQFVFLGSAQIEEQNLSCIVGLHESYLGSALAAHAKGSVLHWTEYFRQSWADLIYHDRLHLLVKELRSSIASDKGMLTVLDKVSSVAASTDDDEVVSSTRKKILGVRCSDVDQSTRMVIEAKSLEFLKKNRTTLTNFYVPPNLISPQPDMM